MTISPGTQRFVVAIVTAQVLTQIGAFTLPALLPAYLAAWRLSETEAGMLVGAFFAAYVVAVPVLVSLTDRVPARHVYIIGTGCTAIAHLGFALVADGFWTGLLFRVVAGVGWAGAYMPGLKAIAEGLTEAGQSRAVSWHAGGVGVAGAMSFAVAGAMNALAGPTGAFLFGSAAAAIAFLIGARVMPKQLARATKPEPTALLDFRPVVRNRAALGWIIGYTVHTWEMAAVRAWGVTFLARALAEGAAPAWLPGPTVLFTAAGLIGIVFSITGNETAQTYGRRRVVIAAMTGAAVLSLLAGWTILLPPLFAVAVVLAWNAAIYTDSSALTAGTVQAAEPHRRGATMGLHSMAGYVGGFIGPLGVGLCLDWAGGDELMGWVVGFGHLAIVTLTGLVLLLRLQVASAAARSAAVKYPDPPSG
jgi:MFS family permease